MFASSTGPRSAARRRGIVLVLVLGMLGLMALIGVTFATFAGQSLKSGRNFSQGVARPQAEALMDFALAQLINDTNNPLSAIRGHSLLRDMFGNDSLYKGVGPNAIPAANSSVETGGVLTTVFDQNLNPPQYTTCHFTSSADAGNGLINYTTSIPYLGQYYGYDFTRWTIRIGGNTNMVSLKGNPVNVVPQTFEVLADFPDANNKYHIFTLAANLGIAGIDPNNSLDTANRSSDSKSFAYLDPNHGADIQEDHSFIKSGFVAGGAGYSALARDDTGIPFTLDGRYMRAFNGPGLTRPVIAASNVDVKGNNLSTNFNYPYNLAAYGNMRIAGIDPDNIGMDEDYDACDLENWFMAIQSADGQVMIPSFHRPGILTALDWTDVAYNSNGAAVNQHIRSKILRPRQIDNSPLFPADPSVVDTTTGKLTYDIDNDGDGVTDSVWLDLGYPTQRDPNGKQFKPLFAFMVLGLNGRLPLNTVGNLQARAVGASNSTINTELTAAGIPTPAADTVQYPASTGQTPYAGYYTYDSSNYPHHHPNYSSQVFFDTPLYDHASHLGYSVNEINPKFALQNAPSNLYPTASRDANATSYSQLDNAGVSVALTQLRNILAGTMATDLTNPYPSSTPYSTVSRANATSLFNNDMNVVTVNQQAYILPNNLADGYDYPYSKGNTTNPPSPVVRSMPPVPGRWGEPEGIPTLLYFPGAFNDADPTFPMLRYTNPVRAGRSYYVGTGGTVDPFDDDFDSFDPYLPGALDNSANQFTVTSTAQGLYAHTFLINPAPSTFNNTTFTRDYPEDVDSFDGAGQMAVASERLRRFVTPQDPAGVGRMVSFLTRPASEHDYGYGTDTHGRTSFFRYFRPAGMPQRIYYPYYDFSNTGLGFAYNTENPTNLTSGVGQQFLAPVLIPAGKSDPSGTFTSTPDVFNNVLHGYQAMATPDDQGIDDAAKNNNVPDTTYTAQEIAVMGAMPYDLNPATGTTPAGYDDPNNTPAKSIALFSPTIMPLTPGTYNFVNSTISSETGPNVGATIGNSATYPIPYVPNANNNFANTIPAGSYNANGTPSASMVVNGYIGGSLNKDEADEMNLYTPTGHDMPFGPTDLEWLYRKHDVDGATLNSRLSQLAPISFLNPADGLTRRRLFSTDAWDLNTFSYANDNPIPYAGLVGFNTPYSRHSPDHDFTYNSRFMPFASPSFQKTNFVANTTPTTSTYSPEPPYYDDQAPFNHFANPITSEFLPNTSGAPIGLPLTLTTGNNNENTTTTPPASLYNMFGNAVTNATYGIPTPTVAHRDRKINLNFPLPISNDPAEPIRQKWCRETYRFLKAILPPASVDTPEELAALSQFVVNIVDFRDTDCSTTRFVNTDLILVDGQLKTTPVIPLPTDLSPFHSSPTGVRFANANVNANDAIPAGHFPYDPSIYSPDVATPFLVQHGMEYNPIAINEVFAVQYQCGSTNGDQALSQTTRGLFVEMLNTLTESQNNSVDGSGNNARPSSSNSSAIDLTGWDMIITPDDYGWGRPDPITGDVSLIAWPPLPASDGNGFTFNAIPSQQGQGTGNTVLSTAVGSKTTVQQYRFNSTATPDNSLSNNIANAINGARIRDYRTLIPGYSNYFIVGGYSYTGSQVTTANPGEVKPTGATEPNNNSTVTSAWESAPIVNGTTANARKLTSTTSLTSPTLDVVLPESFIPYDSNVTLGSKAGNYFWVYLRRPANPFDTLDLSTTRRNREMVVVDSMRFAYSDLGTGKVANDQVTTQEPDLAFSAQRLQPFRGGHLVPVKTTPGTTGTNTAISVPSPGNAYGYSEQTTPPTAGNNQLQYVKSDGTVNTNPYLSQLKLQETIGQANDKLDTNWAHLPFHDRDFSSVADLLLVPGCPPGLFTKQFVEEPYPGHAAGYTIGNDTITYTTNNGVTTSTTAGTATSATATAAKGWDKTNLAGQTTAPAEPELGRKDFGYNDLPAAPTYPYLTDNFYYTAASVAPPFNQTLNSSYTHLTTEIGGWTGTGWHKMFEFFEVPSSANGAIGTADTGNNYDWYRADTKPGQINLNLLIDEEVFAGLIDDPRLNENLAVATVGTTLPMVVSQIDVNGYPAYDTSTGIITGRYPMFPIGSASQSINIGQDPNNNNIPGPLQTATGRGYVLRDPNSNDYVANQDGTYNYQQVHGLKAAFSDFLKLRHGGSGYLFAHGAGDVAMGDFINALTVAGGTATPPTQPVAADRPYRSPSYPDINYTIMRPASLPPSPVDTVNGTPHYPGTAPVALTLTETYTNNVPSSGLFIYAPESGATPVFPYLNLGGPLTPPAPYAQDPGIRNPYLDTQYNAANQGGVSGTTYATRRVAPPYDVTPWNIGGTLPSTAAPNAESAPAPFPPTIPPTPARRLFQVPDFDMTTQFPSSNASLKTQQDSSGNWMVNEPVYSRQAWTAQVSPPTLIPDIRAVFMADNATPQPATSATDKTHANNHLGAGPVGPAPTAAPFDLRQHPAYRTELLQKISNLTTVRTHQFATWITVGFFEVVKQGTPELGIPDVLGQELGSGAGNTVRYRSFFVIDRTKATGFNPYYPGNFRDCVTFRRRIE